MRLYHSRHSISAGICWLKVIIAIGIVFSSVTVDASSVVPMDLSRMADHAGQVLIGTVTSKQTVQPVTDFRVIETMIVFENVQYLKNGLKNDSENKNNKSTFNLKIPGGTHNGKTMRVCCAPEFKEGNQYILFLLPSYKTFPTVGLGQGVFEIRKGESDIKRVYQAGQPVTNISSDYYPVTNVCRKMKPANLISSNNARVVSEHNKKEALTLNEFIKKLQPVLDNSETHVLSEPAGKRLPVDYTAKQLINASDNQTTEKETSKQKLNSANKVFPQSNVRRIHIESKPENNSDNRNNK